MTSKVISRRLRGAALACSVAAACALTIPQVRSAATGHSGAAAAQQSASGIASDAPTFVQVPADQAAHPSSRTEWWYTVGHLHSQGHEYGYEVNLTGQGMAQLAITDVTAGKFYTQTLFYKDGQYSASSKELDVQMPDATLSGPLNDMHLTASLPQGRLDLRLDAKGPAIYNNGTGLFPFLDGTSYYYSLPNVKTRGTLTLKGRSSKVTGQSWLDHQWGTWDWSQLNKWTWMAIQLDNGEYVNLWDLSTKQGEQHWATVLHRDGSESIVSVKPVAKHATDYVTSPTSGQRYAGKWTVEIPALKARFTVKASPALQELTSANNTVVNEATSTVKGTYQGKPATGRAYVEQLGDWK